MHKGEHSEVLEIGCCCDQIPEEIACRKGLDGSGGGGVTPEPLVSGLHLFALGIIGDYPEG